MPAAIADCDDLYAWLIRGFVEAGLPDHTQGQSQWSASGALNLENFIQAQGAGGVLIQFSGQAGAEPVPEDEYTYAVSVVRDESGQTVVVRSEDTLFHHVFPGGPEEEIGAFIANELRSHSAAFTEWRAKGGVTTMAQRRGLPEVYGVTCDPALVRVLEGLRRSNRSITEGPANGWWLTDRPEQSQAIEVGLGQEPIYVLEKKAADVLSPEDIAHAGRLRTAGTVLIVSGVFSMLFVTGMSVLSAYKVYSLGMGGLTSRWWLITSVLAGGIFGVLHLFAGSRLRALRSKTLVSVFVVLGMLPCLAPCCGAGIPAGAWALYLLRSPRSAKVLRG